PHLGGQHARHLRRHRRASRQVPRGGGVQSEDLVRRRSRGSRKLFWPTRRQLRHYGAGRTGPETFPGLSVFAPQVVFAFALAPVHGALVAVTKLLIGRSPCLKGLGRVYQLAALLVVQFCEGHGTAYVADGLNQNTLLHLRRPFNAIVATHYISITYSADFAERTAFLGGLR